MRSFGAFSRIARSMFFSSSLMPCNLSFTAACTYPVSTYSTRLRKAKAHEIVARDLKCALETRELRQSRLVVSAGFILLQRAELRQQLIPYTLQTYRTLISLVR